MNNMKIIYTLLASLIVSNEASAMRADLLSVTQGSQTTTWIGQFSGLHLGGPLHVSEGAFTGMRISTTNDRIFTDSFEEDSGIAEGRWFIRRVDQIDTRYIDSRCSARIDYLYVDGIAIRLECGP